MKKCIGMLFFCLALFDNSSSTYGVNSEMVTLYNELKNVKVDPNRTASVENITIHRDVATFHLEKGTIYFFKPVSILENIHVTGAIFIGDGTFSFTPPTKIEREQLARFHAAEEQTFETGFDVLFMRFSDTTFSELSSNISFKEMEISPDAAKEVKHCEKYVFEERNDDIIWRILINMHKNPQSGYFHAHVGIPGHDPVFFTYDPLKDEEITLKKRYSKLTYEKELVNSFHQKGEDQRTSHIEKSSDFFARVKHYKLNSTIESSGDFSSTCDATIAANTDSIIMLHFWLASKLKVDSIVSSNGMHLSFHKDENAHELLVFLDSPLTMQQEETIRITCHGDILDKFLGNFYINSSVFWYPRISRARATYDLTFKTPKQYEFVTIGTKLKESEDGNYKISHWKQATPVVSASFNLGPFKTHKIDIKGAPPITVCMSDAGRHEIAQLLIKEGIPIGKNMEKQVGADVANSIQLFRTLFGPYPYDELYVTEIPYDHGEAFPGLLHLSRWTFQVKDEWGYEEIFRAHEVAHQWWGTTVGYKTYHDQWLSEGFAQYVGLWYMQWIKKDNKRFFQILDEWKDEIFSNRKYILGSGTEAGPIWLGYRTSSSETKGDYWLIIYKKGAYVLHMLRNMLVDLKTMDEDRFKNMMQDFFKTYKGKDASTEDFKRMVEKHCGEDMDWFFKQWIYGTDIPTYKVSYNTTSKPDGKYLINLRVVQEDVPDDFKMYVPITVKFKGDQFAHLRFTIDKPFNEFSIPSPMKPEKIIFNDFNSVLAKVKYVKYE